MHPPPLCPDPGVCAPSRYLTWIGAADRSAARGWAPWTLPASYHGCSCVLLCAPSLRACEPWRASYHLQSSLAQRCRWLDACRHTLQRRNLAANTAIAPRCTHASVLPHARQDASIGAWRRTCPECCHALSRSARQWDGGSLSRALSRALRRLSAAC